MGVICGIYNYNGKPVTPEVSSNMMRQAEVYSIDATGIRQENHVFLGCHAQHITPESANEISPYHDEAAGLTITADAIIDNRTELCEIFGIDHSSQAAVPDSQLILRAYRKWGQDCTKYLLGDFAFVIWDERQQKLFCAVDHAGTRTFYYYRSAELFAFSTLMKPLLVLPEISKEYNETWIADFLAITSLIHQLDPELTLYQNIYLLPAGHSLTIWPDKAEKQLYWQAEQQSILNLKSDGEYEEAFKDVFGKAVRWRLRSIRPVGVMMSGGLDSTSVACMAARELAKTGGKLSAFSSVPMTGYRDWLPACRLADETPYIEEVRKHAGNIDVIYCRMDGKHSLSDTDRLLAILEQPYKTIENLFWLDGIMAAAQERNVGVILTGDAGNLTISWGTFVPYLLSLLKKGQWYQLFYEAWAIARRYRCPSLALLELFLALVPQNIQNLINSFKNPNWRRELQELSPINPEFAQRTLVMERFRRFGYDPSFVSRFDSLEARLKQLRPNYFGHLGVFTTKHALAYRLALRDPTMDKRVIEFCLSLPENQYVRNGRNRFLLRRAMDGILPDKVRKNDTVRGRQSADLAQRLQPCWPELTFEIKNIGFYKAEREYLDIEKIQKGLVEFKSLNDDASDDPKLIMLIRSLIFSRFLRRETSC